MLTQQELDHLVAQNKMAVAQHEKEVNEIVAIGQDNYGAQVFDDASQTIADKLGPRAQELMLLAKQFDAPHRLIVELSNNPEQLERLGKMPTARMITELARIESRMAPHGHVSTGAAPAWKGQKGGRVSDTDWRANAGDNLSDKAWSREFDRRMAARGQR
jgi:hypothetical protein